MEIIDLSSSPLVDNHCHPVLMDQHIGDIAHWREFFTEGFGEEIRHQVPTTLYYRRMLRHLAGFLDCEPTEEAILQRRNQLRGAEIVSRLLRAANLQTLVLDTGFPPPRLTMPLPEMSALSGAVIAPLLRLEILMQELITQHDSLHDTIEALNEAVTNIRSRGYAGLKSIVAYRTGLHIERWESTEAEVSFNQARRLVEETGSVRLSHKPLLDTLLHVAFAQAAAQELPVQFHTGYGDTDADMLLANPLYLRSVLEDPVYRAMKVVLLHESYPYTRQGGYLSAVYENVYLDLSYAIPFLSFEAMCQFTREAFGVAPLSKLLYSSDAVRIPELYWFSAIDGRRVLETVLSETIATGDLNLAGAEEAGAAVLRGNARRLYGL